MFAAKVQSLGGIYARFTQIITNYHGVKKTKPAWAVAQAGK